MSVARNGSVELVFDVAGTGPDLLLIAGVASTRPIWSLVRPQLAQRFRTIAFDSRDNGESTIVNAAYGLPELAADALAVMDAAGSSRAHVVGHSLGGAVAQELAIEHPDRVTAATLVSTWARGDVYGRNVLQLMRALTEHVEDDRSFLAALLFVGCGVTTLRSANLFAMTDLAMALGPLAPRAAIARQWDLAATIDTFDRLGRLKVPAHVIWGTEDRLVPPWLGEELSRSIPHARATPIEGCGHVPMVAAPAAFAAAIEA